MLCHSQGFILIFLPLVLATPCPSLQFPKPNPISC
jgi:hypothetical protein